MTRVFCVSVTVTTEIVDGGRKEVIVPVLTKPWVYCVVDVSTGYTGSTGGVGGLLPAGNTRLGGIVGHNIVATLIQD